jgi:hypothetical protein
MISQDNSQDGSQVCNYLLCSFILFVMSAIFDGDFDTLIRKYFLCTGHSLLQTELCRFSGAKIYLRKGIRFIHAGS